jgi:hypothetical protein
MVFTRILADARCDGGIASDVLVDMEWLSRRTSIAGTEIPNWVLVLGAIVVIWLIYRFI